MATATLDMPTTHLNLHAAPRNLDRIVLTGFMGSGKTTAGRRLAERLGWRFLDLDHEIERREGSAVPTIFSEHGEAHFRRVESAALAAALGERNIVLALGGGVPEELGNRLLLEQTPRTAVIHLTAGFQTLVDRCLAQPNATERPNLANLDLAAKRYELRRKHYDRVSSHTIETTALDVEATVDAMLDRLHGSR